MKHKRLNRDGWGVQYYPYYQMRIDDELFHGTACLIRLTDGEKNYWETPKAGRIQVTGEGMTWLELVPDDTDRLITIMYFPDGTHDTERHDYPVPADAALKECDRIMNDLCRDISGTDAWCTKIRDLVERKIAEGEPIKPCKEVLEPNRAD